MNDYIGQDEGVAWPSYVDFLTTFSFVLILFLGYTTFVLSGGVSRTVFVIESKAEIGQLSGIGVKPFVDWRNRRITIPLDERITFASGCPGRPDCPDRFQERQEQWLRDIFSAVSTKCPHAKQVLILGRADRAPVKGDPYGNFELANRRAMAVYKFVDQCLNCGPEIARLREKIRLANAGDKDALGTRAADRTVVLIVDYAGY